VLKATAMRNRRRAATRPPRQRRASVRLGVRAAVLALFIAAAPTLADLSLRAGSLASVAPAGASAAVAINITGTGFNTTAANNEVTFTHSSGVSATALGNLITTVNATQGLRRLRVNVPSGLPAGTAALRVRNLVSGELSAGQNLQIVTLSLPETTSAARGASEVAVRLTGSSNSQFVNGSSRAAFVTGITVHATVVESATTLVATISIAPTAPLGPGAVSVISGTQTATVANAFTVVDPNRAPAFSSTPITEGDEGVQYVYQAVAADPDGDSLTYRLTSAPAGMTISATGVVNWIPGSAQVGPQNVDVEVSDGRGGTAHQPFAIVVRPAPSVESIEVAPSAARFTAAGATRQAQVLGRRSNGSTVDLTGAASGTVYENSNPFVASISDDGLITGLANGATTITARNGALSDVATVEVEIDVTLQSLELTPAVSTLRASGAELPLTLRGRFSDGTVRDLTNHAATGYQSSNVLAATIAFDGRAVAVASGDTTITARHEELSASATIHVVISTGAGFLRGEVYNDIQGLPLGGATISLLADGGGPLNPPVSVVADDRGRFTIAGRAGDAVVRIHKPGFMSVERRGSIPAGTAATLLDARLTPLATEIPITPSAFGGVVRDGTGRFSLQIAPGGIATDLPLSVTAISPQGLAGQLPFGWSPVTAAAVEPSDTRFGVPATLTLPNIADAPVATQLTLARYSVTEHAWIAIGPIEVAADGLTLTTPVNDGGAFAVVAPDTEPAAPPNPIAGAPLAGVAAPVIASSATAAGDVVPRSAPPGDGVRALGRIGLSPPAPISSGAVLHVNVNERFDLLNQSQVVTPPFTQDIVLYARPRPPTGGTLGATFPITPSRSFTIQELMLGVVRLDVATPQPDGGPAVIDAAGGVVSNAEGDELGLPPGAVAAASAIELRRILSSDIVLDLTDFDLLAVVRVDAVGALFSQPATLSIAAPASIDAEAQVFVARLDADPFGVRRLRLAAITNLVNGRLVSARAVAGLTLPGIASEGDYAFLRSRRPFGFTTGVVTTADTVPRARALVTLATGPFSDVTALDGRFIVPAAAAVADTVRALDTVTRATANGAVNPAARDAVALLNLTLASTGLTVVSVNPPGGATSVPLDTSITIDFAVAVNAASLTDASASVQAGGTAVATHRTLSADRRRLTIRPTAPLAGRTTFTVLLTSAILDTAGNSLTGYTPSTFATLDPTRSAQAAAGQIVAELPDEDGFVRVSGATGVASAAAPVVLINARTQASVAVLALADGSFQVRVAARLGDELSLILRDGSGRDVTLAITQFGAPGRAAGIGAKGGSFSASNGYVGSILPRSLAQPGVFEFVTPSTASLPTLPVGFEYADRFAIDVNDAAFASLATVSLSESQNRFPPQTATDAPFAAAGSLTTPSDALVNSLLRFTGTVVDGIGARRTVTATTSIVVANPDPSIVETSERTDFPSITLEVPRQATPNQLVNARAIAPAARIDFERPANLPDLQPDDAVLLVRPREIAGVIRLEVLDRFTRVDGPQPVLRTAGRELSGVTSSGDLAVIIVHHDLAFVSGLASGPAAAITSDGLPFVVTTAGANGRFVLPVRASEPFTVRITDLDGSARGTVTGSAPASGNVDVGNPLGAPLGQLRVTARPDSNSIVDLTAPVVFTFSEPIEARGLASAIVVTDDAGSRVFGATIVDTTGSVVTFRPARRWRFGTTYRIAVATTLQAISGARLSAPFSSQFTTFRPAIVGNLPLGETRDVALRGALAVAATAAGLAVIDTAAPQSLTLHSQSPLAGGASGITFVPGPSIVDRPGTTRTGVFAVAAAGSAPAAGIVQTFDVSSPFTPVAVGSAQVTAAAGTNPPAPVPQVSGTPRSVIVDAANRAFVSIEGVGVSSLMVGQSIPADPTNPGGALGARYPAAAVVESASQVVSLRDRLLVAGAAGLTVLDGVTLVRRGGVSTEGSARGVAALLDFATDRDGNGTIENAERFDIAAVANGADETLQLFRVPATGDPVLISVIRLNGETDSVVLNAGERLAYVGLGTQGVAFVDLEGAASIQPIDFDGNGVDDRILGVVDTPGNAGRTALDVGRGLGFIADGAAGLTVAQLFPPRTAFLSLLRDPRRNREGDEESILESRAAMTTDEAIHVGINAASAGEALVLVIEETPDAGGVRLLTIGESDTSAALGPGLNNVVIDIASGEATGTRAVLKIQTRLGQLLNSVDITIRPPDTVGATLTALDISPADPVISNSATSLQLSVGGLFTDGRMLNLTSGSLGTRYASLNPEVATVDQDGLVTARAGGTATIVVTNGTVFVSVALRVDHAPALVALEPLSTHFTLRSPGQENQITVRALFSDRSVLDAGTATRSTFTSSDPSVVEVTTDGRMIARREGVATITITNGGLSESVDVAVEFREPAVITGITMTPLEPITTDARDIRPKATVTGTGTLDGIPITFSMTGAALATLTIPSSGDGEAIGRFRPAVSPGLLTISASVVNPATGATLATSATVQVRPGGADLEPNNSIDGAVVVSRGRTVTGAVDAASDAADVYRLEHTTDGVVTANVTRSAATSPIAVTLFSGAGTQLQRIDVVGTAGRLTQTVSAGPVFLRIDAPSGASAYSLSVQFAQAAVVVQSVTPLNGAPGTAVTISGAGFSQDLKENLVFFGHVAARVTAATTTRLETSVPANAVNAALRVAVIGRQGFGPVFATGNDGPPPPITIRRPTSNAKRFHPGLGATVQLQRLIVNLHPHVAPTDAASLVSSFGAVIAGTIPDFNVYIIDLPAVSTVAGLDAVRRQLQSSPLVATVAYDIERRLEQSALRFDSRDSLLTFGGLPVSAAYTQADIFRALEAIRRTPPFDVRSTGPGVPFHDVTVAVIDTGFQPDNALLNLEFTDGAGRQVVELIPAYEGTSLPPSGLLPPTTLYADPAGHGTAVTSVIAAVNSGQSGMTGALNGLFTPQEPAFAVLVYMAENDRKISDANAYVALADIKRRGNVDVVNMSFGTTHATLTGATRDRDLYRPYVAAIPETLVVMTAGNDGVDAAYHSPSNLSTQLTNVMSIGASAISAGADKRALFGGVVNIIGFYSGTTCSLADQPYLFYDVTLGIASGSNCFDDVTLSAPGQDVFSVDRNSYQLHQGTSIAAPLVASVAALLRAIRQSDLSAEEIKTILVESADDISLPWEPGSMRRLNALRAVHWLLPHPNSQAIYVADRSAGHIVALEIEPFTGLPSEAVPRPDREIPLTFVKNGVTFTGTSPRSLTASPIGEQIYAVVESTSHPDLGDGVLLTSTFSQEPIDFIPLSGAEFPPVVGPILPAVRASRSRAPMTVSRDGRLLYVAAGSTVVVVNVSDRRVVRDYVDLPSPYKLRALSRPIGEFAGRLNTIAGRVATGVAAGAGTTISDLTLSPDGTTLYAAFLTGGGGGTQPGGIVAVNVDLYKDASPSVFGLQTDLSHYMEISGGTLEMLDGGPVGRGDEPTAVIVGPHNRHVYMLNSGLHSVEGFGAEALFAARFTELIGGAGFGLQAATGFTGGIAGTLNAANSFANTSGPHYQQLLRELRQLANEGIALIVAPGFTAAFSNDAGGAQQWLFPAEIVTGWNVGADRTVLTDADSGLLVSQFTFPEVFAKRPSAAASRPSGRGGPENRRALVAFAQTGNFGVLDLSAQAQFRSVNPSNPAFASLDPSMFHAFVGVTPAIPLGPDTWPSRGSFRSFQQNFRVPSADEALLFTSDLEYAQNGRFAVAAHPGTGDPPGMMNARIPDFVNDLAGARVPLLDLGFTYSGGDQIKSPDGSDLPVGASIALQVGGGAVSIINDDVISRDFTEHLDDEVDNDDGGTAPYYSRIPICEVVAVQLGTTEPAPECAADAVTRRFDYTPGPGLPKRFVEPRGVAIQPFVAIESPHNGDHVTLGSAVHVTWRDDRITEFQALVFDLDDVDADGEPQFVHQTTDALSEQQLRTRSMAAEFGGLFPPSADPMVAGPPFHNRRYRVDVRMLAGGFELSRMHIDVRFENLAGPVPATTLDLSPTILPFVLTPGGANLSVMLRSNSGPPEDVTDRALYAWVNGSQNGGTDLAMDPTAVVEAIRNRLLATRTDPSVPVDFGIAPATITSSGAMTLADQGMQIVQARFDALDSRPTVVLGGFNVDRISLEVVAEENPFEADTLGSQVVATLGPGTNAPLVIAPSESSFIDDDGQVVLDDVILRYNGGGFITLDELMQALRSMPAVNGQRFEDDFSEATLGNLAPLNATPAWRNAQAAVVLMEGPGAPSLNYELQFQTTAVSTAFVQDIGFFGGRIASNSSGIAVLSATLDLGRFGSGSDSVLVWSVSPLESVTIRPPAVSVQRTDPPLPGPTVRLSARTAATSATISRPSFYSTDQEFKRAMLPTGFVTAAGLFTADGTIGSDPQLALTGGGIFSGGTVQFNDFRLAFDVPHDEAPDVTVGYTVADSSIVALGARDRFEQHLVHQNKGGHTTVSGTVTIAGLGSATGQAAVIVSDVPQLPGGPVILELALSPQQDWNDSAGGNGVPFDAIPGNGVIDGSDVWVEVSGGTTGTQNWVVELRDATGATFTQTLGPPVITSQTRILSGFAIGTHPIVRVRVIDQNGVVRQEIDIAAMEAVLGTATGLANETLTFSIFGSPTLILQQFLRRSATINVFSPF
jgi:hypothetical protein